MKKSVMISMIAGSLAVIIISFIIMTPVFLYSFGIGATNEHYSEIESSIDHVKPLAQMSLGFNTQKMFRMFDESMSQFSYFTKSNILFLNRNGDIIWANVDAPVDEINSYCKKAVSILGDNKVIHQKGMFDNLYKKKTITVGEIIEDGTGAEPWIIFCTKEAPDLRGQYKTVMLYILLMELVALIFSVGFMYMFSRRITGPLKKINTTVNEFSNGHFEKRVEYKSENELGELAENINNMADSISNLEKMRSDFVSDVSHELRTPMTSISGFVEGILDGTVPKEKANEYLEIVLSESKRLSRLVNELLSISRLESGKIKIERTNFDIVELARLVLIKFEKIIDKRNINVEFVSETDPFMVNADKDTYTQVLTNLIHNATKFTPEKGIIKISITEKNKKCIVSIENSGEGIEKDKLNFIWERFYKTDNSRSTDKSGVGLGLYIVKKILDAHNEKIFVSSIVGEKTIFSFTASRA